jgi:pimeloyl-ACP methyl ester carboxylesterase
MLTFRFIICWLFASLTAYSATGTIAFAYPMNFGPLFETHAVHVDGSVVSLTVGGRGPAIVLLHGYAEDSRMWRPLATALANRFTIIAADLPGIGNSSIPADNINMKSSAKRIRDAVHLLGYNHVSVAGHDIGLMVAYAYASLYPREVSCLVVMDAFLPGVTGWEPIYNNPANWHFRFYGPTPLALVRGRFCSEPTSVDIGSRQAGIRSSLLSFRTNGLWVRILCLVARHCGYVRSVRTSETDDARIIDRWRPFTWERPGRADETRRYKCDGYRAAAYRALDHGRKS